MAERAIFGPPIARPVEGGTLLSVHVLPVHEGRLVAFDISAPEARGRWLPWAILDYGANPYETASALLDDWCSGTSTTDLRLVDVISRTAQDASWEVAIVFRAELTATPTGDAQRHPHPCADGELEGISGFGAGEIARWLGEGINSGPDPQREGLLF